MVRAMAENSLNFAVVGYGRMGKLVEGVLKELCLG